MTFRTVHRACRVGRMCRVGRRRRTCRTCRVSHRRRARQRGHRCGPCGGDASANRSSLAQLPRAIKAGLLGDKSRQRPTNLPTRQADAPLSALSCVACGPGSQLGLCKALRCGGEHGTSISKVWILGTKSFRRPAFRSTMALQSPNWCRHKRWGHVGGAVIRCALAQSAPSPHYWGRDPANAPIFD